MADVSTNAEDTSANTAGTSAHMADSSAHARAITIYLACVNVGAVGLFGWDKLQTVLGGWRVSERDLCLSAAAGGWAGGLVAMRLFRHKMHKEVDCVWDFSEAIASYEFWFLTFCTGLFAYLSGTKSFQEKYAAAIGLNVVVSVAVVAVLGWRKLSAGFQTAFPRVFGENHPRSMGQLVERVVNSLQ